MNRRLGIAAALMVAGVSSTGALAQGTVRGQVRIIDRPGTPTSQVRDVVVWLESDSRNTGSGATRDAGRASAPQRASVAMRHREFEPHVQIVGVGGSVDYPNDDPFSHNVFSNSTLGAFDLGLYRTGKSRAASFKSAGVYAIYCNIHSRMVNYVVAVPSPYVTRVLSNGTFVIDRVPVGAYRLRVWHERAQEHAEVVQVPPTGLQGLTLALDARGYVAKEHANKFGLPYTATRADRY